jgi:2-polyprenyl-3-methyl-5-hydroxy-6-metoxy-1,4-benzoquinol methylase
MTNKEAMTRLTFLVSTLYRLGSFQPRNCPYCGSGDTVLLQRKKLLLELRRCRNCFLMYRYPKDDLQTNVNFYQADYQQGMTTEIPTPEQLAHFLATNFRGSEKDLSQNVRIVKEQVESGRLLDYGCSWGYGVYQFRQAGYDAIGFEISKPRAAYGRKHLKVEIIDVFAELDNLEPASFDVIHCSHVLEHLPELQGVFTTFRKLLKPSGALVIFVPNAGGKNARELGVGWGPMICEKHCLALDARFFMHNLPAFGFAPSFGGFPYYLSLVSYDTVQSADGALDGDELLVVARTAARREFDA